MLWLVDLMLRGKVGMLKLNVVKVLDDDICVMILNYYLVLEFWRGGINCI